MKILVTGGAGFIGSYLVKALAKAGHEVAVIDNLSTGLRANISKNDAKLLVADLNNCKIPADWFQPEVVFHLAASNSVPQCNQNPIGSFNNNTTCTFKLLEWASKANVKRFIFASSSSVYGNSGMVNKEHYKIFPISAYGLQKATSEKICEYYNRTTKMKVVAARFFNVYGKRQRKDLTYTAFIPKLLRAAKNKEQIQIYGDGQQSRSFTCVYDIVHGLLKLLECENPCFTYNLASEKACTVNDIIEIVKKVYHDINVVYTDARPYEINHSAADISQASSHLGYAPVYDIEKGVKWMLEI